MFSYPLHDTPLTRLEQSDMGVSKSAEFSLQNQPQISAASVINWKYSFS